MIKFATIRTLTENGNTRNVTLSYSTKDNNFTLLGNLPHGTKILLDDKLINDLSELLNHKTIFCKRMYRD